MAKLIKVQLHAQGADISMVSRTDRKRVIKYQVKTNTLQNITSEQVKGGFIVYAYINEAFLKERW